MYLLRIETQDNLVMLEILLGHHIFIVDQVCPSGIKIKIKLSNPDSNGSPDFTNSQQLMLKNTY